ncbi:MAG: hypothetical protein HXY18_13375 [Bryobacteraceae bacterium]|nr:hypothetical protein [Bryobacteraceae bacterium]
MSLTRRRFFLAPAAASQLDAAAPDTLSDLWRRAPSDVEFQPRTRWWWPGSAVTPQGITAQLEQMKAAGIGGAEIVHYYRFTEFGNRRWGSPEWAGMIRHALNEAARLGMKIAMVFSPGWDFGAPFVPPTERSKVLAPAWLDLSGPFQYEGPLPPFKDFGTPRDGLFAHIAPIEGAPEDQGRVVAVVGARITGKDSLDPASLVDLTSEFHGNAGRWRVEQGQWRLFAFRLQYTGQQNSAQNEEPKSWVVDHLSEAAMRRYANTCAAMFKKEFGQWIPSPLESIFADSFEAVPLANTLLWSNGTLPEISRRSGYDLTPLLPALWFDIGRRTEDVRYDVNRAMHGIALDACFRPFLEACASIGLKGRIQPHYRFTEEIVEGAGLAHLPETEVTTARFETVPDPRKATVSGARFYGRPFVSAEAYTFLHRERYRASLEELKRATDAHLRDGIARFYNHGWLYTEEPEPTPDRDMVACERIQPWAPWWPWYKDLAAYVARCSAMLRQGEFAGGVLLYSPQATVWRRKAIFNVEQRIMRYGDIPKTLVAHGWDYDIVNDHLLQTRAEIRGRELLVANYAHRAVILAGCQFIPPATLLVLKRFAEAGGTVIACGPAPEDGNAFIRIPAYPTDRPSYSPQPNEYEPTPPPAQHHRELLQALRRALPPDIVLPLSALPSQGLCHHHRRLQGADLYFLANLQPARFEGAVEFAASRPYVSLWHPVSGQVTELNDARPALELRFAPWESYFVLFSDTPRRSGKRKPVPSSAETAAIGIPAPAITPRTLTYSMSVEVPKSWRGRELEIDLGRVHSAAEIRWDGAVIGRPWCPPFSASVPRKLSNPGLHRLEVSVAALLLASVQARDVPPEPPPHLGRRLPPRNAEWNAWLRDRNFKPLPPSGIGGPVTIRSWKR